MPELNQFCKNYYSQNGEDGFLEEILRRLEIRTGSFVEFGAWDGKHLINTYHLLEQGWSGVYIEGNKEKFTELVQNMKEFYGRVEVINEYVEPEGEHTLDKLLSSTKIQKEFDVLSIDVDSCDWQIWESFRKFKPRIVIIEINSSIPVGIYQTHRGGEVKRSSFSATVDLGTRKGYTAVCHTCNLFFVAAPLIPSLKLPEADLSYPETLFDYGWKRISYEPATSSNRNLLSRLRGKVIRTIRSLTDKKLIVISVQNRIA